MRPGFEDEHALADAPFRLTSHRLDKLLRADEYHTIGATPRIQPRPEQERQPKRRLVDLEHARMAERMLPKPRNAPSAASRFAKPADFDRSTTCTGVEGELPQPDSITAKTTAPRPYLAGRLRRCPLVRLNPCSLCR